MLVLALAGLLAALAAETLPRVPGMRFRLGMEESAVLALGSFPDAKVPDAGTMSARQGPSRFFGVPGEATLYLEDGRLAWLKFEATGVSSHSQDYADGQLRRMHYARACERDERGDRECDWTGPGIRVHTAIKKDHLVTRVERWPPPEPAAEDSVAAPPVAATHGAKAPGLDPPPPATSRPATGSSAAASPAKSSAAAQAPSSTPSGTEAKAPAPSAPRPAAGAAPPPSRPPAAVVTLPETLMISLASRNSPDVWPRIVSSPTLNYPEAARRESVQGVVWVMALVDASGQVVDAWIDRGLPELETAALAWVSRSKFAPCERNGAPCRFHVRVAVLFTLH